ncbi:osmoprotectant transport system permease protein [Melghirimyces profundicolus]|uniref:Osmoprotectant transport system permease protein n=1 Tax=Melghirimyces profundicolus TaxID=1242148 RepID=A0A2T6AZW9_9BACL|nr:ABC transporter permease [Melghirimyces profundicolus]PTX49350.1 osmoprotectant transport system permease protein [Melghirimyces profundicolus]
MERKKFVSLMVRYGFYALVIYFFVWSFQKNYFSYLFKETETFVLLTRQHLELVAVSSLLAIAVALPSAVLVTRPRFRQTEWIFTNLANLGQTIPVLAVLALMISILGLGFKTAVFALFIYSVLPIFRNTVAGLNSIDDRLIDAAKGMGMKPHQILFRVELPNAAYSIMAGIRTAIVINVGTAAFAFLIGGGGLGVWIFTGIRLFDNSALLSGAVPVTLLAILADYLLRLLEYVVVPKGTRPSANA